MARGNTTGTRMACPGHILICESERESRAALAMHFEQHGFRVTATAGSGLMRMLERARIDAIILGLQSGDSELLGTCRSLRAISDVPLVILAQSRDEVERILALEMGADDYLAKPANPREILARLRNILRRAATPAGAAATRARLFHFDGWQLDVVTRQLSDPDGRVATLRDSDYRVLASLLAHGNRVVTRTRLVELARGRNALPFDRSIDVRISRLRQVLRDDARLSRIIKTVHGEGYVIGVPVERG